MNSLTELVIKIIRGNSKKYKLFFVCNVFAIAMFMSIVALSHNDSLNQLDSIIASNVYAPMYLMGLFLCFFVPYTQQMFQVQTLKDYAVLRSIGMNHAEMIKCLVIQNGLMALFSTVVGIVLGECLELILICIINYLVGIKLYFRFQLQSIEFIFVYAIILFLISIGIGLIRIGRKNIYEQMLSSRVSEEKQDNKVIRNIGIIVSVVSIIVLFAFYRKYSNIAIFCMLLNFIGLILLLGNCRQYINQLRKRFLFWASDWSYYYKRNLKIVCAASILYFFMMYLLMMAIVTFPNFENNALSYHPYDIAFSMYDNEKWIPDEAYIKKAAKKQNISLINTEKMKYLNYGSFSVFDLEEVNKIFARDYQCEDDEAILVNCVIENDGYMHDSSKEFNTIQLGDSEFFVNQLKNDVLFGNGCGTTDSIVLVNHQSYIEMAKDTTPRTLYAYNFSDYTKSKSIYQQLLADLQEKNHWDEEDCPDISCKELALENAKQSSEFLLLLLVYDSVLIIFSVYIIIRFKVGIEFESEKHKLDLLQSMGGDERKVKGITNSKIYSIFLIPFAIASVVLLVFSYGTNFTYGYGFTGLWYGVIVILFVTIITLIMAMHLSKKYFRLMIETVE